MTDRSGRYHGKCLCGGVCIEISGAISDIIHCHCSLCRKSTGSAYATNGFVNTEDFRVASGESLLSHFSFRSGRARYFCSTCGSPVYSSSESDPQRIRIRLGILDTVISERPISHNFVSSRAEWDELDAALPRNAEFEPGRR